MKLWNYWIMMNYFGACCWWAFQGKPVDVCYWLSALAITATVTFGYAH